MYALLLILGSAVCSPFSVRYVAIETLCVNLETVNQYKQPVTSSRAQMASRATITPTNQYNQGSYSQPLGALGPPPRGATLTPTPSSILYGQSAATQQALRPQGPRPFPSGQELGGEGMDMDQRLALQQQMMQQVRFQGEGVMVCSPCGW